MSINFSAGLDKHLPAVQSTNSAGANKKETAVPQETAKSEKNTKTILYSLAGLAVLGAASVAGHKLYKNNQMKKLAEKITQNTNKLVNDFKLQNPSYKDADAAITTLKNGKIKIALTNPEIPGKKTVILCDKNGTFDKKIIFSKSDSNASYLVFKDSNPDAAAKIFNRIDIPDGKEIIITSADADGKEIIRTIDHYKNKNGVNVSNYTSENNLTFTTALYGENNKIETVSKNILNNRPTAEYKHYTYKPGEKPVEYTDIKDVYDEATRAKIKELVYKGEAN